MMKQTAGQMLVGFVLTMISGAVLMNDAEGAKRDWDPMGKEAFLKVTQGRCPVIWSMNPNDPGYEAMTRENAASGILAAIHPVYLANDPRVIDMEYGDYDTKRWKGYYRGTDWDTLGWGIVEPPVRIPRKNFPVRYRRAFNDEILQRIKKDGLFLFVYNLSINKDGIETAEKCRKALGDKFVVMRTLEEGSNIPVYVRNEVQKKNLDLSKLTKEQCFEIARECVLKHGAAYPDGFGFGDSGVNIVQVVDILKMDRWDMELANGSRQIDLAFCRGVKNQYDIPFIAYIACYNTSKDGLWGKNVSKDTPYERFFRFAYASGGKPSHLLNRTFWVTWFSDANAVVGESTYTWCFVKGKDADHFELSPLGKKLKKLHKFADSGFFDRGVAYTPACILMDYCHGWTPCNSIDAHSWDPPAIARRKIWGVLDYKREDFMVDNFFGAIFPGYENAAGWGSPYGDLVNTPYGDSFDVMLSNASLAALKKYKTIFLIGNPTMTDELFEKLSEYVKSGGVLALNAEHLTDKWKDLLGLKMTPQNNRWYKGPGMLRVSDSSQWGENPPVKENRYFYYIIEGLPENAEPLAINPERDHPVIVKIPVGKGAVYLNAIQYMQECSGIHRLYGLTECSKQMIRSMLTPYQKVSVHGEPLEYIVRRDGERLLVMVVNNKPETWKGKLGFVPVTGGKDHKLKEWYQAGEPRDVAHENVDGMVEFEDQIDGNDLKLYTLE